MQEFDLDHIFAYHAPDEAARVAHERIKAAAKVFAQAIIDNCPSGADRSAAIRQVREAMFTASAAIALEGILYKA